MSPTGRSSPIARTTKFVDDTEHTGWFTEDFTLEELKTLRTKERIPDLRPRMSPLDGVEPILTFDEVLDIALQGTETRDKPVGVYVETKHPSYFAERRHQPQRPPDRRRSSAAGLTRQTPRSRSSRSSPATCRRIRDRTPAVRRPADVPSRRAGDFVVAGDQRTYADLREPEGLEFIASYADGIGPYKDLVIARDSAGNLAQPTGSGRRGPRCGLMCTSGRCATRTTSCRPTCAAAPTRLAHGDAVGEYLAFFDAGVDGVFSDFTQTAVQARSQWLARQ